MEDSKKKSGFATAGLVLGIIGICTSFIPIVNNLSFILAIIGLIFSIVSLAKKASKGMSISALIICIITVFLVVTAQQSLSDSINNAFNEFDSSMSDMTGDNTEEILKNSCDVVLGDFKITTGEYGIDEYELPVTVTNKTSETKSFSIQIEAIKSDGTRITTDYIYANNLTAGQSQKFKAFQYVSSENATDMKSATFKIVEVSMY